MRELIINMSNKNIGSLCLFINNTKNIQYLNYVNENIPIDALNFIISEKIYYFVNNISNIQLCICGKKKSFIGFKNGYRLTCGDKRCHVSKRRETCLEKYGVDNPKKSSDINEKSISNIKKKWGGNHFMKDIEVRKKFKDTMLNRYGVEWAQQSIEISEKSNNKFKNNPDREDIIESRRVKLINKSEEEKREINLKRVKSIEDKWVKFENFVNYRLDKISKSSLEKWGEKHHFNVQEIIDKRSMSYYNTITKKIISKLSSNVMYLSRTNNTNNTDSIIQLYCSDCKKNFEINRQYLDTRYHSNINICLICNPILTGKSNMELDVSSFIENYKINVYKNVKNKISKEIDIYIPDLNLAFEFNGLYWHSDVYKNNKYHLNKTKECENLGIKLFHIWEDDWIYKQDIIKSMILNKLGKTTNKIGARKCQIKEIVDNKIVRSFLQSNHIQGFVGSKVKLGLFYNGELVSLMTFGNLRKSLGSQSKDNVYELLRFCNKLNTNVVGGASKLFNYFIKNYLPEEVVSYSDSSRSDGNLYKQLGFDLSHETDPNYYWVIDGVRKHRFNYRKDKLIKQGNDPNKTEIQIMNEKGFYRIWDCGNKKWILKPT